MRHHNRVSQLGARLGGVPGAPLLWVLRGLGRAPLAREAGRRALQVALARSGALDVLLAVWFVLLSVLLAQ